MGSARCRATPALNQSADETHTPASQWLPGKVGLAGSQRKRARLCKPACAYRHHTHRPPALPSLAPSFMNTKSDAQGIQTSRTTRPQDICKQATQKIIVMYSDSLNDSLYGVGGRILCQKRLNFEIFGEEIEIKGACSIGTVEVVLGEDHDVI